MRFPQAEIVNCSPDIGRFHTVYNGAEQIGSSECIHAISGRTVEVGVHNGEIQTSVILIAADDHIVIVSDRAAVNIADPDLQNGRIPVIDILFHS